MCAAAVIDRLATLSAYARQLLEQAHSPVEAPIRSELFGVQRFRQHGLSLARAQPVQATDAPRGSPFFPRVDENLASLRDAFDYIALISRSGRYVSPAAEWLLDNFHLVEAQLQQIREGVPRSYYARLPKLAEAPLAGLPRVYGIAWAYVAHTDSVLNNELFTAFLDAYQDVDELTLGELWALPTTLRVVLLENLRRLAESIARTKVALELAHAVWDAADTLSHDELEALFETVRELGLEQSYCTQLWQRLSSERAAQSPALVAWTEKNCPQGPALIDRYQTEQAAANLTVGNIITTLRAIGQVEWADLIEPVSRSLRVLRELPSFAAESELTRQQITHAMEQVARASLRTERSVAEAVLQLATDATHATSTGDPATGAESTAGYYLFGRGRPALMASLARPSTASARPGAAGRPSRTRRLPVYLGGIALGMLLLLTVLVRGLRGAGFDPLEFATLVSLLLMALPLSEAVIALVHRMTAESMTVQALPRLDFGDGIPSAHRVLVVIPSLLGSPAANAQLARRLELHWLANRERHAQFALLTDWSDAAQATTPGDESMLADALHRIAGLNAAYPAPEGEAPRFLMLHRPRTWSDTEEHWLGWERKRGKLEMLLRLLATGDATGFLPLADGGRVAGDTRYVLTLDSDTGLPPGALRELVAIAA
ncbi:MAG: hypothetical protein KKC79_11905, partial [Gammaproteobacteria bacterium]|nr:hypothetical protein [Gammaproteobacteria bacterium]